MAKTTAPLFGFDAAGQVGSTLVFSSWRGVPYARRYTVPSNPRTAAQTTTRTVFSTMSTMWVFAPSLLVAPWNAYATGKQFLGRNAFMGQNIGLMRGESDMQLFRASPGARGGLPPNSITATPGSTQISVAFDLPDTPPDWTLVGSTAIAFIDQDPESEFATQIHANQETSAPETNVLSGLTATELYVVAGFLEWTKPNGETAYSVSLSDTATPTS